MFTNKILNNIHTKSISRVILNNNVISSLFCTTPTSPSVLPGHNLTQPHSQSHNNDTNNTNYNTNSSSISRTPEQLYHYESFNKSESSQDSKVIFELIFGELSTKIGGDHNMALPKDIMWLCGAPGSGKGEMTEWIKYQRGYHSHPIKISEILTGPEIEAIKAEGQLVSDRIVISLLLEKLLNPDYKTGVIVDGFPRTRLQAECIKLLFDKMLNLRRRFDGTQHFTKFRRPVFHITVLYVDRAVSITRQLQRGREQSKHNELVRTTGIGSLIHIRETDIDELKAQQRYEYFHDHIYSSIQSIKEKFPFHFISAEQSIENVKNSILKELEYQSSSELGDNTFDMVRQISLASEIKQDARHKLVTRLDGYAANHREFFQSIIDIFKNEFEPHIRQQALTGTCIVSSENIIFTINNGIGLGMMLDLLAERGYRVILDVIKKDEIIKVDINNGNVIKANEKKIFKFHINFPPPKMRHAIQTYDTDVSVIQ